VPVDGRGFLGDLSDRCILSHQEVPPYVFCTFQFIPIFLHVAARVICAGG